MCHSSVKSTYLTVKNGKAFRQDHRKADNKVSAMKTTLPYMLFALSKSFGK